MGKGSVCFNIMSYEIDLRLLKCDAPLQMFAFLFPFCQDKNAYTVHTDRASINLERRIITASHVLCFSCFCMALNLRWIRDTMHSISLGEMGRVRDCSLNRFITWPVNSLHACTKAKYYSDICNIAVKVTIKCFMCLNNTPVHTCPVQPGRSLGSVPASLCSLHTLNCHH